MTRTANGLAESRDFVVFKIHVGDAKQCSHCLLRRSGEVRADDVRHHIVARALRRLRGIVHVSRTVFLVIDR